MQKKLGFAFSLAVLCYLVETSPVNLGTLEFDNLDTDLDELKYEVEEEDLDDFSKMLDEADDAESDADVKSASDKSKTSVNISGFKKKNTKNSGSNSKHNIQDVKKFFKNAGVKDQGAYDDDDLYASVDGLAAKAVGVKGNEERKYRKGTKIRGFHRVQHKDEYKKDKQFYEDDETTGTIKKIGGKTFGYKIGAGAGFNKGHYRHNHKKGIYGKQGFLDKGFSDKEYDGFTDSQGFDGSFYNDN